MNLRNGPTREFDVLMFAGAVALLAYGAALIYSGSLSQYGSGAEALRGPVARQMAYAILGIAVLLIVSRLDYRLLGPLSPTIYVVTLALLVYVLFAGTTEYGSRRWIEVPGFRMQPSELAKVSTVILLAKYFSDHEDQVRTLRVFLTSLVIAGIPALLVLLEPDLGSASVFFFLWLGIAVVAGVRGIHLAGLFAAGAALAPLAVYQILHGYQKERIDIWRDPTKDPLGSGFNILQAEVSIGSGGLWGKGFTDGTQTQLDYLRTQTTDYVFSVAAEELGFIGVMVLFGLFVLVLFRCLRVAGRADDMFGRLMAVGIPAFILFQVFVNIAVNIRLIPVTGVPLPLVSLGGSSLVTVLLALGILQSVLGNRRKRSRRV